MFDEVFGLPAHALIVHGAVVLGPLLCLTAIGYTLLPRYQAQLGWLSAALAVVAPLATLAAVLSGQELLSHSPPGPARVRMETHQELGETTLWLVIPLGLLVLLLLFARRTGAAAGGQRAAPPPWLHHAAGAVVVVLAVVALFCYVRTGHTGAQAVWGGG